MRTDQFRYLLPSGVIAQRPAEPRDSARLLDADRLTDHTFRELPDLLEPGDLLVVNRTRVRHARLIGHKVPTGGRVELLLLRRLDARRWEALVRPARRLRPGVQIQAGDLLVEIIGGPRSGRAVVDIEPPTGRDTEDVLLAVGELPLPPYFRGTLEDPARYQTVFAERVGSAAAPTAGLHFTTDVLARLAEREIEVAAVELEVGVDTFRPIAVDEIERHDMHAERYTVPAEAATAVEAARRRRGRVVAVGTTVVRTLESAAEPDATVRAEQSDTRLFITPGYRFQTVDALITNFHVPGSTLVVLVASFMGDGWRRAYAHALARGFRFLSFGDAMLCRRAA